MTAQGIVVELEDHTSSDGQNHGGSTGTVFTGQELTNELNWYTAVASAYATNSYVWFGTDNEPSESPSAAALSDWQLQTYRAIRNAGNNSIVMVEMNCWPNPMTCGAGYTTSDYALMTNIVWDPHYYNWLANHSADQGTNNQAVAAQIAASQTLKSADGTVPVIVGEYGPSTTGSGEDAGGMAAVSAVIGSGVGSAAWHWNMGACGDSCDSLDNGPTLSLPFGTTVAGYIASDATGAP